MILFFYTALKPPETPNIAFMMFDDPFLLHCSQTAPSALIVSAGLMILFFYTALKQARRDSSHARSLMILFFYTALKQQSWSL